MPHPHHHHHGPHHDGILSMHTVGHALFGLLEDPPSTLEALKEYIARHSRMDCPILDKCLAACPADAPPRLVVKLMSIVKASEYLRRVAEHYVRRLNQHSAAAAILPLPRHLGELVADCIPPDK